MLPTAPTADTNKKPAPGVLGRWPVTGWRYVPSGSQRDVTACAVVWVVGQPASGSPVAAAARGSGTLRLDLSGSKLTPRSVARFVSDLLIPEIYNFVNAEG